MELFHLTIGRKEASGAYSVELRSSAGDTTGEFRPPFRGTKLKDLLQRVADGKLTQGELRDIGSRLFDKLFKEDVLDKYRQSLSVAKRNGPLRIVLSLAVDELHRYPWELMYDGSRFLAASGHVQLLRRIGLAAPDSSVILAPLRVLVAVADPVDVLPDLDIQREVGWIASVVDRGDVYVEIQPATRHILQSRLREGAFDVFHFSGHGAFVGTKGCLCFEQDDCCVDLLPADAFKAVVEGRSVRLVVLSACESAITAPGDVFSGVAQALVQAGIPAVVAMGCRVSDVGAGSITREFYNTLRLDYDVTAASTEARRALYADRLDWHAPILYTLHVEKPVFERGAGTRDQPRESAFKLDLSFCPTVPFELQFPSAIQFTKRRGQKRLGKALIASTPRIVTVDGPPGSGKTALASEMARRLAWAFPGGVLGLSCQTTNTLEAMLAEINEQLLGPWEAQVDLAQPWGRNLLLAALKQRPYLLILDNFETVLERNDEEKEKILDFLAQILSPSKALLTSRQRLDLGQRVRVDTMEKWSFATLLARIGKRKAIAPFDDNLWLRAELVAADPKRVDDLLTDTEKYLLEQAHTKLGGLPWAAEVFMGLVAAGENIADLLADLAPLHRKMTPLLDMSYDRLSEGAQELLLLMSSFHKPVKRKAIEAVSARTDWEASLEELIRASLVTSNRYSLHPLIKEYAGGKFTDRAELRAAHKRAGEYFLEEDDRDVLAAIDHFYEAEAWQPVVELANGLAEPLFTAGLWGEARDSLRKAVQAARSAADAAGEARSLGHLGIFYESVGQWEEATALYNKCLEIDEQTGDINGVARTYGNLGNVCVLKGQWDQAIGLYNKALKTMEQAGDVHGMAQTYTNLGSVYLRKGQWNEAIDLYNKSLEIDEQIGDVHGMAQTYTNLGSACVHKGQWEEAIELCNKALTTMQQLGDVDGLATIYGNLGLVYANRGQSDEAIGMYQRSLEIKEQLGDIDGVAQTYGNLSRVYASKGQWDEAIEIYHKSLEIKEKLGDAHGMAQTYANLGSAYLQKGQSDEAIEMYQSSLEIKEQLGDVHGVATTYGNLGLLYANNGQWDEAIEMHQMSLDIKERLGDIHGMAQTYGNMGNVYLQKGEWDEAIDLHNESLQIDEQVGDVHGMAQTYTNLGRVYLHKGQWDEAIALYNRSLDIDERVGDVHGMAQTYTNMGSVYLHKGQWDEAIELYNKALKTMEQLGDVHGMAQIYGNLGNVYADKGQWDEAIELYNKSLEMKEQVGDIHGMAWTWGSLAALYEVREDYVTAMDYIRKALDVFNQLGSTELARAEQHAASIREKIRETRREES